MTIRVQDQRLKVQVDSGAEVNIIDHTTYRNLSRKPPLRSTNAKLKPYESKPIPVKGCFRATVRANGRQVNTTFYVTAETSAAPIIGKYTAFDLDILKISVNELLQKPARKQTSTPSQGQSPQETQIPNTCHPTSAPTRDQSKPRTTIPAKHHSYSTMSQQLIPLSKATNYVKHLHQQQQHSPKRIMQKIVEKHPKVFEGIGKHKYRQVGLIIDETVTPKVQAQRRIPFQRDNSSMKLSKSLKTQTSLSR